MKGDFELGYAPRDVFRDFHVRKERFACIVAHRRAGKTVAAVCDLIDHALRCKRAKPRFAYVAPYVGQAKDVAWGYLKQYAAPIPGAVARESELRVDLPNGARVRLYGADNPDRLRGLYLDGVVLDEFADMDPTAWTQVIRPTLADREGCVLMIASCAASPPSTAVPPQLTMPQTATRPCDLYQLPEAASLADLEVGFAIRGAQLVDCDGRRRLAVETAAAEHQLEQQWRLEADRGRRPWWRFWR